jgi:hypothetical protein
MSLRKFFDQDRGQNYVFWMKENRNFKSANATYGNSHLQRHRFNSLPRFKNNPHALVLDRTTTEYWNLSVAQKLNSDPLFIRPCKMKDGTYSIRILHYERSVEWNMREPHHWSSENLPSKSGKVQ